MREIKIKLPDKYCNDCVFYHTAEPDPESCTGFGGFREYYCRRLNKRLDPDWNKLHKKHDMWAEEEYKVPVCKECLRDTK